MVSSSCTKNHPVILSLLSVNIVTNNTNKHPRAYPEVFRVGSFYFFTGRTKKTSNYLLAVCRRTTNFEPINKTTI